MDEQFQQDLMRFMQEGQDIQVRDSDSDEEADEHIRDTLIKENQVVTDEPGSSTPGGGIEEFMPENDQDIGDLAKSQMVSPPQQTTADEILQDIEKVGQLIKSAQFNKVVSMLQQKLMNDDTRLSEDTITFFNISLIYSCFKIKEYKNANILAGNLMTKLQRQVMFSLGDHDEIPFPLKYLQACSNYELKNSRDALSQLYNMQVELEKSQKIRKSSLPNNPLMQSEMQPNQVPQDDDDFGVFEKKQNNSQKPGDPFQTKSEEEVKLELNKQLKKETNELFGLFPPKDNYDAKMIMLGFEITRIHQRQQDFRNAYYCMTKLVKTYPNNPYILSRIGRLCLESGRKQEAQDHFNKVQSFLKDPSYTNSSTDRQSLSTEGALDSLLNNDSMEQDLEVVSLMNKGYVSVFEGNHKEACETFRRILAIRPANIIAANNVATCQIFCNETLKAIESLEKLVKVDPKKNLNEQVVSNLMSFYDIQYPFPHQQKQALADYCSKQAKDNVNAAVYVQKAPPQNQALNQSTTNLQQSQHVSVRR